MITIHIDKAKIREINANIEKAKKNLAKASRVLMQKLRQDFKRKGLV